MKSTNFDSGLINGSPTLRQREEDEADLEAQSLNSVLDDDDDDDYYDGYHYKVYVILVSYKSRFISLDNVCYSTVPISSAVDIPQ
jgi:hypothetical protein